MISVPSSEAEVTVEEGFGPSDSQLMEETARGDREAFASLIGRHQRLVLSIAARYLGDRDEAEDAAQEVFIRLWHGARRYQPSSALEAYLRTLTVNLCLDMKRKRRFVVLSGEDDRKGSDDPQGEAQMAERRNALDRALQNLPSSQRMAVVLFHMEGLNMGEVARLMETSPKAVESLLSRARAALRERLAGLLR